MLYQQPQGGPAALSDTFVTANTWAWTPTAFASGKAVAPPEVIGAVVPYATPLGLARQVESASAGIGIVPVGTMVPGRIGFVFQFQLTSLTSTVSNICGFGSNGTPNSYVEQFRLNCDVNETGSAGKFNLALRDTSGNKLNISTSGAVLALGQLYTLVIFADSGTTAKAWLNGQPIAVVTSGLFTATAAINAQKQWMIGNFNYGSTSTGHADANFGTSGGAAKFSLVARVEGGLEKFQALAQNPYQLFADQDEEDEALLFAAAAGGGASVGSLTTTLGALSGTSSGTAPTSGQSAIVLASIGLSATAAGTVGGASAVTLAGVSKSIAGAVDDHVTTAGQLGGMSLSATATASTGTLAAVTLGSITPAAAATVAARGTAGASLAPVTLAATGTAPIPGGVTGSLSAQLAAMTGAAGGTASTAAAAATTLGQVTLAATAEAAVPATDEHGAVIVQLAGCTTAAAATATSAAQAAITLRSLSLATINGVRVVAGAQIVLGGVRVVAVASGEKFTPSAARTFRFAAENRRYRVAPENRTIKFSA